MNVGKIATEPLILSADQLAAMMAACPPLDAFGPDSEFPALLFQLADAPAELGAALRQLPCPVIGVGRGSLAADCDMVLDDPAKAASLVDRIARAPLAAMVLVQHLRASEHLSVAHALTAESMAYATVQTGPEFRAWQSRWPGMGSVDEDGPALLMDRDDDRLLLTMNRAGSRNAIGIALRDALCEGMELAVLDPQVRHVVLTGAGRCFSVGGDVREFGQAADPVTAHWVRSIRLPASRAAAIADRLEVRIQGAAIGAGIEIAAFARRVVATPDAWFQLPELEYGLIPGAGGTVSIPRRIGRQRAAAMMLTGRRVRAREALDWGLIDAIEQ